MRAVPAVEPVALANNISVAPPPKVLGKMIATVAFGSLFTLLAVKWAYLEHTLAPASSAIVEVKVVENEVRVDAKAAAQEVVPLRAARVETELQMKYPVPLENGAPLDEKFPSLREWVHPVTNSAELFPPQTGRHFGQPREGLDHIRPECGEGHCGVDLDGPRGRPLVAVADGTVVRVEHAEMGLDGRSGRYVRIEHEDGTLTAYMHMDDIADGIQVGSRVHAGQYLGTLGATAVYRAAPHCHFSLEIPNHPGQHGDTTDTHYIDPAPFLVRATIIPVPDRRHAERPAS
jgi:murein DD-endopeptidase MepM/ murein hydrolase activator NlpD